MHLQQHSVDLNSTATDIRGTYRVFCVEGFTCLLFERWLRLLEMSLITLHLATAVSSLCVRE